MSFLATDCARAREAVSIQLDGELPELELDRLTTHLRFCPECDAWAEQVRDITLRLREATLELPAERLILPRRGRRWAVGSAVALASAAAVIATMFVSPGGHRGSLLRHTATAESRSARRVPASARLLQTQVLQRVEDGRYIAVPPDGAAARAFRPV